MFIIFTASKEWSTRSLNKFCILNEQISVRLNFVQDLFNERRKSNCGIDLFESILYGGCIAWKMLHYHKTK